MRDKTVSTVPAGFGARAAAYIIDRALLWLALCLVRVPAWLSGVPAENLLFDYSAVDIVCYVLSSAYLVLLTYFTGSTLGKKVLRLRVVKADGSRPPFIDVLYRETVGRFLSGILYIGYLMALADRDKRAFHDWLCGTRVVYDEKLFNPPEEPETPWTDPGDYTVPGRAGAEPPETERPARREAPQALWMNPGGYTVPGQSEPAEGDSPEDKSEQAEESKEE